MSELVKLLEICDGLSFLNEGLSDHTCSRLKEEAALDYFNYVKNTNYKYSSLTMYMVRPFLAVELANARMNIIHAYNTLCNTNFGASMENFYIAYNFILNRER